MTATSYPVHTRDTAPAGSKPLLERLERAYGFVPNLAATLAEAPAALEAYLAVAGAFSRSSLSAAEQQVVLLSASVENECHYCVAAHSTIAAAHKVAADVVESLRSGTPLADPKLEALRAFTRAVVRQRGWVADELDGFLSAGYSRAQALEVIAGVGQKIISNYVNHIAHTPVDAAFAASTWSPAAT